MDLLLHVTRGEDNRFSGIVSATEGAEGSCCSRMLGLMRVSEELGPFEIATSRGRKSDKSN